ncbi:MAG: two-component system sensor histidine kinase NtrB [Planctomycetota bacterium]|jgi:PAS domain S-box-containing protein
MLQEEYKAVYDNVDAGMVVIDQNGRVLSANPATSVIFGVGLEAFVDQPIHTLFGVRVEEVDAAVSIALRSGSRSVCSFSLSRPNSTRRFVEAKVIPLPEREGQLTFLLTLDDRTEHQAVLDAAAQRDKMASIGLLAAGVAHEFNNIWSAVQGYAELAKQDENFLSELVEVTLEQAERASGIVKGLLSFSDKKSELRQGIVLDELIRSMMHLVSMELKAQNIKVVLELEPGVIVDGSQGQLQLVLLNLIMNAIHAIGNQGEIKIILSKDESRARIALTDNGCGMTEDEVASVFNPFYTTKGAFGGRDEADGHGLGLTLSYNLVLAHQGRIDVESVRGEGSTFTLSFPLGTLPEAESSEGSETTEPSAISHEMHSILLVEDELMLHGLLGSILQPHRLTCVTSGQGALDELASKAYDAVFLDLVLEDELSGFDVFDHILSQERQPHVILLTGRGEDERLEAYREKAAAIIKKPFSVGDVHSSLRRAFG